MNKRCLYIQPENVTSNGYQSKTVFTTEKFKEKTVRGSGSVVPGLRVPRASW